jgi:hypothetical protein
VPSLPIVKASKLAGTAVVAQTAAGYGCLPRLARNATLFTAFR